MMYLYVQDMLKVFYEAHVELWHAGGDSLLYYTLAACTSSTAFFRLQPLWLAASIGNCARQGWLDTGFIALL